MTKKVYLMEIKTTPGKEGIGDRNLILSGKTEKGLEGTVLNIVFPSQYFPNIKNLKPKINVLIEIDGELVYKELSDYFIKYFQDYALGCFALA